jgi:hypothetical protein
LWRWLSHGELCAFGLWMCCAMNERGETYAEN